MALVTLSTHGQAFSSLLAPFTGVNNGTARLLKAITASELATLRDGDMVYVQSIRDYWKWAPASTATDDSTGAAARLRYCNPTVNGANPGRFERLFIYSPDWLLQNFAINSATGNNEADGVVTPLANDNELQQRWGDGAQLAIPITVTYAQSPTTVTNYDVEYLDGGGLRVTGISTVVKTGTISAVTVVNPATQTPWNITGTLFAAGDVQSLVRINAGARINNTCVVAKSIAGNQIRISPFGELDVNTATLQCFVTATPVVNDTYDVLIPITLTIGYIKVRGKTNGNPTYVASSPVNCVVFDTVKFTGLAVSLTQGSLISESANVYFRHCLFNQVCFRASGGVWIAGGAMVGGTNFIGTSSIFGGPFSQALGYACFATMTIGVSAVWQLGQNCLYQASGLQVRGYVAADLVSFFDRATASSALVVNQGATYQSQFVFSADLLWGDANAGVGVRVLSTGALVYVTKPTINTLQGAGRQSQIGGTNKDWAAVPYVEGANLAMIGLTA